MDTMQDAEARGDVHDLVIEGGTSAKDNNAVPPPATPVKTWIILFVMALVAALIIYLIL